MLELSDKEFKITHDQYLRISEGKKNRQHARTNEKSTEI